MRTAKPYSIEKRKDRGSFRLTISRTSGLPPAVCRLWDHRSFSNLPQELARYRSPKSRAEAEKAAVLFIEYLRNDGDPGGVSESPTLGDWMQLFLSPKISPRAKALAAEGTPYSSQTIYGYVSLFNNHIANDPALEIRMSDIEKEDVVEMLARISEHKIRTDRPKKQRYDRAGKPIPLPKPQFKPMAGTRHYTAIYSFIRMTFRAYQQKHSRWLNPFNSMKPPKDMKKTKRNALEESEIARLFAPGVMQTPLERAVGAAMFWAGLRRSEIFALKPDMLIWGPNPRIRVERAWKNFARKTRELGDPKHHKIRETLFPDVLQKAIKDLWAVNGKHEFIFCNADGSLPGATWFQLHVKKWLQRAAIDLSGRKITPHSSRHSVATLLEKEGVPLRYIQTLLGHSDLKTTYGYLDTPANTIERITQKIEGHAEIQHTEDMDILK